MVRKNPRQLTVPCMYSPSNELEFTRLSQAAVGATNLYRGVTRMSYKELNSKYPLFVFLRLIKLHLMFCHCLLISVLIRLH